MTYFQKKRKKSEVNQVKVCKEKLDARTTESLKEFNKEIRELEYKCKRII